VVDINFEELKNENVSGNWEKIGSKFNNPILSIFPDEIKESLSELKYELNKIYYFDDDTHEFKIHSLIKEDKPFFILFAKAKHPVKCEFTEKKSKFKYGTKIDQQQIALIVAVAIILIASVALSGPIFKVLGV